MDYYVLTEPDLSENFWIKKYISGMKAGVRERKGRLIELTLDDLPKIRNTHKRVSVILNGRSSGWIARAIDATLQNHLHPILLASHSCNSRHNVSSVSFDFYGIYTAWCEYVLSQGWHRMALLGVNRNAEGDSIKREAFQDYNNKYNRENRWDIYYIDSSLEECCKHFLEHAEDYDAVLCANDLVSIVLLTLIRTQRNAEHLQIHAFWDSPLSEYIHPKIKTISLDYAELGRKAIRLSAFLADNPDMAAASATVCGQTELKERSFRTATGNGSADVFLKDRQAQDIYSLENLFSSVDTVDMQIIRGILRSTSYEQLAEELSLSVSAVKYRVKRMLTLTRNHKREELVAQILKYFTMEPAAQDFKQV